MSLSLSATREAARAEVQGLAEKIHLRESVMPHYIPVGHCSHVAHFVVSGASVPL
jgi:hypothetical protein